MNVSRELGRASVCAGVLGVVSAFGDWLWSCCLTDGAMLPGVAHGVVIFALLALTLGWALGRSDAIRRLLFALPGLGLALAAGFYPIAAGIGYLAALMVTWVAMWLGTALLLGWAAGGVEGRGRALVRGGLAAILSGLAFWSISAIWTVPSAGPPNYLLRGLQWTWAFWPGFLALLLARPHRPNDI